MNRLILLVAMLTTLSACHDTSQPASSEKEIDQDNLPYSRSLEKASDVETKLQEAADDRLDDLDNQRN